jgi:phosphoribosylformimino-5-aminoimidazole carboxamide ribotide isomerase
VQDFPFQIIPVIDLMHGQVVHAKHGLRERYQPIKSQLCDSSDALNVVTALLKLYPFRTIYIADIDAILGSGSNDSLIDKINLKFPNLNIWLDAGSHHTSIKSTAVLGTECISDLQRYLENKNPHVLSLDFNTNGAMGISELHDSAQYWPTEVICMTLNAVGGAQGIDAARLEQIIALNKSSKLYAAGGVRNIEDLQTLASMSLAGALIASALHNGKITQTDIAKFYAQ